jgi:hypothetical protein
VFLSCKVLKIIKDTSYLKVGVLPQARFRITAVEGESHPHVESPLIFQLLLLGLLYGVRDNALGRDCLEPVEQEHREQGARVDCFFYC